MRVSLSWREGARSYDRGVARSGGLASQSGTDGLLPGGRRATDQACQVDAVGVELTVGDTGVDASENARQLRRQPGLGQCVGEGRFGEVLVADLGASLLTDGGGQFSEGERLAAQLVRGTGVTLRGEHRRCGVGVVPPARCAYLAVVTAAHEDPLREDLRELAGV